MSAITSISIPFVANIGGVPREFELDLWAAKMLCERLEEKHALQVVDGCYRPTIEFVADLQSELPTIGTPALTVSAAVQIWSTINARFAAHVESLKQANAKNAKPQGFVKQIAAKLFGGLNRKQRRALAARAK